MPFLKNELAKIANSKKLANKLIFVYDLERKLLFTGQAWQIGLLLTRFFLELDVLEIKKTKYVIEIYIDYFFSDEIEEA